MGKGIEGEVTETEIFISLAISNTTAKGYLVNA
jgi:hypothetical protein